MGDDMGGLFADIEVPVVVTRRSGIGNQVEEAWELWVDITKRPDRKDIPEKFRKEYIRMLKANYPHDKNLEIIEAAARMEPRPRDPNDIRRVIMPLTNLNHERVARARMKNGDPVIEYVHPDTETTLSTLEDVADACETEITDWIESELEAAGILISLMDRKTLMKVANKVALHIGEDSLVPTDILKHHSAVLKGKITAKARADRGSYQAGVSESSTLDIVKFDVDPASERLMLKGKSTAEEIVQFHNLAPEGYWDRVRQELDNQPSFTPKEIYDLLRDEFDWHPSIRATSSERDQ